jgi:hypothetical protein
MAIIRSTAADREIAVVTHDSVAALPRQGDEHAYFSTGYDQEV